MDIEHTALEVADRIIRLAQEDDTPVTPMQVQKLTYFCHAWMLGLGHGRLFQDAIEAWEYGPIIRAVYHALKHHGRNAILEPVLEKPAAFSDFEARLVSRVWQLYGHLDGLVLSRMTHAEGSPWHQVYQLTHRSQIIHNHIIRTYYANLVAAKKG